LYYDQAVATGQNQKYLDGIKAASVAIKHLDAGDTDRPALLGFPASYWIDLRSYDAAGLMKDFPGRVLVLAGERDFQVPMTDFELWKKVLAGKQGVTFKSYPSLNHMFMPGQGKSTEEEYHKAGHVAPEVIDDLAKFLSQ